MTPEHRERALIAVVLLVGLVIVFVGPIGDDDRRDQPAPAAVPPEAVNEAPPPTREATAQPVEHAPEDAPASGAVHAETHAAEPAATQAEGGLTRSKLRELTSGGQLRAPRLGPADALVTIVEVGSFQCSACKEVVRTNQWILQSWPDEVAIVFKHNPQAREAAAVKAAVSAIAAQRQGKFWEYHDRIFAERSIDEASLARYAREVGLEWPAFYADRRNVSLLEGVQAEQRALEALGVAAGPVVYLVGNALLRAESRGRLQEAIEAELEVARAASKGAVEAPTAVAHADAAAPDPTRAKTEPFGDGALVDDPRGSILELMRGVMSGGGGRPKRPVDPTVWRAEVLGHEPVRGKADALVTIVEFSDFECIHCATAAATLRQVLASFPDDVRLVWKNRPLSRHETAMPAARAAMEAQAAGKFWQLHDRLFERRRRADEFDLETLGNEIGLRPGRLTAAVERDAHQRSIEKDIELARRINARSTPTLYVNGRVLRGAKPLHEVHALVEEELEKAREMVNGGIPRARVYAELMENAEVFQTLGVRVHALELRGRPSLGPPDAPLVLVSFMDFQSLNSRDNLAHMRTLVGMPGLKGRLRVVFKHYPHPFHKMAKGAAVSALAAHAQGKFFEMADAMFANQRYLMHFQLARYAEEVGLDMEEYEAFVTEQQIPQMLEEDLADARVVGIQAAPNVFLNGRRVNPEVGYSVETFRAVIDESLGSPKRSARGDRSESPNPAAGPAGGSADAATRSPG